MKALKVYATAANINGKKSNGCEDLSSNYKNWRSVPDKKID